VKGDLLSVDTKTAKILYLVKYVIAMVSGVIQVSHLGGLASLWCANNAQRTDWRVLL
jgi:hypothetical protein